MRFTGKCHPPQQRDSFHKGLLRPKTAPNGFLKQQTICHLPAFSKNRQRYKPVLLKMKFARPPNFFRAAPLPFTTMCLDSFPPALALAASECQQATHPPKTMEVIV
jgi:hypothetical protein